MRHALLLAQRFDKRDGRLLRIRDALREAGYVVTSLAMDSGGDARRDPETKDLRPRATGLLMLASQLIMAGIIAGYFNRFFPVAMTIGFWSLIAVMIALASPFGRRYRLALITRTSEFLGRIETGKTRYGLVWAVDPESLRLARAVADRDAARLIFDAHEFHREEAPGDDARRAWVTREEENAAPRINQWVTINESIANLYAEAISGSHPAVICNAIDPHNLDRLSSPLRAAAGVRDDEKILLYHGSLRTLRHLPQLIDASNHLPDDWKLVVLGDGPLKAELMAQDSAAIFLDPVDYDALPLWVAGADMGAILYEDAGLNQHNCSPNKLYEYIALGVPLLTSNLPELKRYTDDAGCGRVVSGPITAGSISAAIKSLSGPDLSAMKSACQRTAKTLSWQDEKAKLIALLSSQSS